VPTIDPDMLGESRRADGVAYYGGFRDGIQAQAVRFSATGVVRAGEPQSITVGTRHEAGTVFETTPLGVNGYARKVRKP
jgi:hypothetical protein